MERFRAQNIVSDGDGPFHANRFRIYFKPNPKMTLAALADDFMEHFENVFNGTDSRHISKPPRMDKDGVASRDHTDVDRLIVPKRALKYALRHNDFAYVTRHVIDRKRMLQFTADMRILWGKMDMWDAHDDWVAEVWREPGVGLAVETQRDLRAPLIRHIPLPHPPFPPLLNEQKNILMDLNAAHFLAGRRSWVLGELIPHLSSERRIPSFKEARTDKHHKFMVTRHWYLETAAVERFSSHLYTLASKYPQFFGVIMPKLQDSIRDIWITQLHNFVQWCHLDAEEIEASTAHWPSTTSRKDKVRYAMKSYETLKECLAAGWVKDVLATHPALKTLVMSSR